MTNLEIAQQFVLGQCLGDYPEDATFDEIIALLKNNDYDDDEDAPLIRVWEPLEYCDVVHIMENMVSAVTRLLDQHKGK
jgi:hypothetical protein